MSVVTLHRIDAVRRMRRFYRLDVQPDLVRAMVFHARMGRIGRGGQMRETPYPTPTEAGRPWQVMKTLPFLRNKLASHGQGAEIVDVPVVYGELAMQLAATFHNFLISKHLERKPPEPVKPAAAISSIDDDIPF